MPLKAQHFLLFLVSACTATRPDGAYTPDASEDNLVPSGFEKNDGGEEDPDTEPTGVEDEDAGEPGPDDVMVEPGPPPDPSDPLSKIAGRYLMRIDNYSTATASSSGNTLTLQNRVSNLYFTELKSVNGTLQATEQLCDQNYEHNCVRGCGNWTTEVDPLLPAFFRQVPPVQRTYVIDEGGTLRAPQALLPLGYDDLEPSPSTVPGDYLDANVWKYNDPGEADPTRAGVRTFIRARLQAVGGAVSIDFTCLIDSAQLWSTSFEAELSSLDAASLTAAAFAVRSDGSNRVRPLYFQGNPMMYCNEDVVASGDSQNEAAVVRFQAAGSFTGCPKSAAAFDQAFPANPKFR